MENLTPKRPGPKPVEGEPVRRYSISIRPSQALRLTQLGEGNLSLGVRRAIDLAEPFALKPLAPDAPPRR